MDYLSIGSLTVSFSLIAFFVSTFISAFVFHLASGLKTKDFYWNTFFLAFLTWKLSYIISNFPTFVQSPVSVLYFNGGKAGIALAGLAISVYWYKIFRKNPDWINRDAIPMLLLYFGIFEGVIYTLGSEYIFASLFFILVMIAAIIINRKKNLISVELLIIFDLVMLLILSFSDNLMSLESIVMLFLSLLIIIYSKIFKEDK